MLFLEASDVAPFPLMAPAGCIVSLPLMAFAGFIVSLPLMVPAGCIVPPAGDMLPDAALCFAIHPANPITKAAAKASATHVFDQDTVMDNLLRNALFPRCLEAKVPRNGHATVTKGSHMGNKLL